MGYPHRKFVKGHFVKVVAGIKMAEIAGGGVACIGSRKLDLIVSAFANVIVLGFVCDECQNDAKNSS